MAEGQPCFNFVGDSIGCAPFTVNVLSCAGVTFSLNFKWKPNPSGADYLNFPAGQNNASFTYPTPGTYIIDQILGGPGQSLKRTVKVFDSSSKPDFFWSTCKDTLIIQFKDSVFSTYKFNPGDGSAEILIKEKFKVFKHWYNFSTPSATYTFSITGEIPATCSRDVISNTISLYKSSQEPVSDILTGVDTLNFKFQIQTRADEPYGFQQICGTNVQIVKSGKTDENQSALVENIALSNNTQNCTLQAFTLNGCGQKILAPPFTLIWPRLKTDNQKIDVSWPKTSFQNLVSFELLRNGAQIKNLISQTDSNYVDTDNLICGVSYCYQFRMKFQVPGHSGQMEYQSPEICGQAVSDRPPDPVKNLTATIEEKGVLISGIGSPLAQTYVVFRKEMSTPDYINVLETSTIPLLDTSADFMNRSYCYKISFKDICGNQSIFSDSICPVWLRGEAETESEKSMFWTSLLGWKEGVDRYELIRYNETDVPEIIESGKGNSHKILGRDPSRQKVWYKIKAIPKNEILYPQPSFSNPVFFTQTSKLKFPDIFTPNEDGSNDVFRCYSFFISDFEMKIFNAWGNSVYYSQNLAKGWDGKINGRLAPGGPYAYWAKGKDENGEILEVRGYFNLVR